MSKADTDYTITSTRRRLLLGALAFTAGGIAGAAHKNAAAAAEDPLVDLLRQREAAMALEAMAKTDDEADRIHEQVLAVEARIAVTPAVSAAGALAGLEVLRQVFVQLDEDYGTSESAMELTLISGAMNVLKGGF